MESTQGLPTCEVAQALQAGGEVALRALRVPQVQGLQGRQSRELPAGTAESMGLRGAEKPRSGAAGVWGTQNTGLRKGPMLWKGGA